MTFGNFKTRINRKVEASGAAPAVVFLNDLEKGIFKAVFPDGMQISTTPKGNLWSIHLANMPRRVAYTVADADF